MKKIKSKGWFPDLDKAISSGDIKAFGSSTQAQEAAIKYGWGKNVIKVERRFEYVYIVGTLDFQPDVEFGVETQPLRVPLLRYDKGEDGIKFQPVVKFKQPYKRH
jgi:hypothetical protein